MSMRRKLCIRSTEMMMTYNKYFLWGTEISNSILIVSLKFLLIASLLKKSERHTLKNVHQRTASSLSALSSSFVFSAPSDSFDESCQRANKPANAPKPKPASKEDFCASIPSENLIIYFNNITLRIDLDYLKYPRAWRFWRCCREFGARKWVLRDVFVGTFGKVVLLTWRIEPAAEMPTAADRASWRIV